MPKPTSFQVSDKFDLNKFIGVIRGEANLTQEGFANKIGISKRQTLWNHESGKRAIGLNFLLNMCKVFGYKVTVTIEKEVETLNPAATDVN